MVGLHAWVDLDGRHVVRRRRPYVGVRVSQDEHAQTNICMGSLCMGLRMAALRATGAPL